MSVQNLISVIVPCYNAEQFLDKTLESVSKQTYSNWECILVNDGSQDNTQHLAEKWVENDQRFQLITQENQGLSGARNTGLNIAKGTFIYFLDSDDLLDSITLENLHGLATQHCDIVFGLIAITERQNNKIKELMNHQPERLCIHDNKEKNLLNLVINQPLICVACNRLYRKEFLDQHQLQFKSGLLHEDELWFFETLFYAKGIILNNQPTYYYNLGNADSITNNYSLRNLKSYLEIVSIVYNTYYLKATSNKNTIASYISYLQFLTIVNCYQRLEVKDKKEANILIQKTFKTIKLDDFEPTLNQSNNKKFKLFQTYSHLDADALVKLFKYERSKSWIKKLKLKAMLWNKKASSNHF